MAAPQEDARARRGRESTPTLIRYTKPGCVAPPKWAPPPRWTAPQAWATSPIGTTWARQSTAPRPVRVWLLLRVGCVGLVSAAGVGRVGIVAGSPYDGGIAAMVVLTFVGVGCCIQLVAAALLIQPVLRVRPTIGRPLGRASAILALGGAAVIALNKVLTWTTTSCGATSAPPSAPGGR